MPLQFQNVNHSFSNSEMSKSNSAFQIQDMRFHEKELGMCLFAGKQLWSAFAQKDFLGRRLMLVDGKTDVKNEYLIKENTIIRFAENTELSKGVDENGDEYPDCKQLFFF